MTIFRNERSAINMLLSSFECAIKCHYLKPMVWNRIIYKGKLFDAMYTFVIVTMR